MSENINIRNFLIKIFEQKANEALVEQLYAHDPGTLPQDLNANNIVGYLGSM